MRHRHSEINEVDEPALSIDVKKLTLETFVHLLMQNFFYTYNKDFIFISHFLDFHEEQEKMAKKWPLYHN